MNNQQHDTSGWVMFATILPSSMAFIDGSAVNVALPAIQNDLGSTGQQLLWVVSGYSLMLASLIMIGGSIGDRLGRKRVFLWGILTFIVGSTTCALSPTSDFLIGARLLQGIGGALMVPGSLSILTAYFPPERRGAAIGTWSAATTITTAGGPILGGFLAQAGLWRLVFLINFPLGVAALTALLLRVPESSDRHLGERVDLKGAAVVTVALAALTFGFLSAPGSGFDSTEVVVSLAIGGIGLLLFMLIEHRTASPLVPLRIFRNLEFSGANLLTFSLYGSLTLFQFFLPLILIQAAGYSESTAGLTLLPFALILTAMSRWMGRITDRFGPRLPLILGPATVGTGFLVASLAGGQTGSYWTTYFPAIILIGLGMGTTVAPLTTTVMSSVTEGLSGTASGVNNAVSRVGGVLFLAVVGAIALFHFSGSVMAGATNLSLTQPQVDAVAAEASNLGNATVPPSITGDGAVRVAAILKDSFFLTFRLIMHICAGFSWLAAILAALFVGKRTRERQ